jgi:hypothetical protein
MRCRMRIVDPKAVITAPSLFSGTADRKAGKTDAGASRSWNSKPTCLCVNLVKVHTNSQSAVLFATGKVRNEMGHQHVSR